MKLEDKLRVLRNKTKEYREEIRRLKEELSAEKSWTSHYRKLYIKLYDGIQNLSKS